MQAADYLEHEGLKLNMGDAAYLRLIIRQTIENNKIVTQSKFVSLPVEEAISRLFLDRYGIDVGSWGLLGGRKIDGGNNLKELIALINKKIRPEIKEEQELL